LFENFVVDPVKLLRVRYIYEKEMKMLTYVSIIIFVKKEINRMSILKKITIAAMFAFLCINIVTCFFPYQEIDWRHEIEKAGGDIFEDYRYKVIDDAILIIRYNGAGGSVTIPEKIEEIPVKIIGNHAFRETNLTDIFIPSSVFALGSCAFRDNKLVDVTISNNVTFIGMDTFCNNMLTKIIIPENITIIHGGAFSNNKLTHVVIPEGVTKIEQSAFEGNELASIAIPDNVTMIEEYAFLYNKLIRICIGENVDIGIWAFENNKKGFTYVYDKGGKLAGTYTRPNTSSNVWTRQ